MKGLKEQLIGTKSLTLNNLAEYQKSRLLFLGILLIAFMGLLLYSNILHAPFVYDDYDSIIENESIRSINETLKNISNNRYLTLISFALNYSVGGLKPFGYHLINNIIHVINALLVYYLIILTFKTPFLKSPETDDKYQNNTVRMSQYFIAFSSAFIFVSHPIQTQAVTYVVQRSTSMAAMFYLLSLVMYIKTRLRQTTEAKIEVKVKPFSTSTLTFYLLSILCAVFAMKTKEIAFTLPVIVILYEFCFFSEAPHSELRTPQWKRFLYLFPILLTILIIPFSMLNIKGTVATIAQDIDIHSRDTMKFTRVDYLFTQFRVIMTYLRLLVFPVNQSLDYNYPVYHSFFNPGVFLSFLFLLLLFGIAVYLFYASRIMHHALRLVAFGIFWFFITLSVESSIIPIRDVIFEQRLYLPSIGFFIASVLLLEYLLPHTKIKIALMVVIVVLLSMGTYNRNTIWKDPKTLWEDVVAKFPNNFRAYNELGAIFREQGEIDKAIGQFEKSIQANSNYAPPYINLGNIQYIIGNYEKAISYFNKALRLKLTPQLHLDILVSLGKTYSKIGDNDNAVSKFKEAIRLFPSSITAYNALGRQYNKMGKFDLAIDILEKALKIKEDPYIYYNLYVAYSKRMERDKNAEKTKK